MPNKIPTLWTDLSLGTNDVYFTTRYTTVCRKLMNDTSVSCGYRIHDLILDILDHGVVPVKISDDAFFSKDCQTTVFEILGKLKSCYAGYPLADIRLYIDQLEAVPNGVVDMLSLHTMIDTTNNFIFSKHFKQFVVGESLLEVDEVKAYLGGYLGRKP